MSDTERILAAIAGISVRLESLKKRVGTIENQGSDGARSFERIERKIDAVASKLLAPPECAELGVVDVRQGPSGTSPPPMTRKDGDK